MSDIFDHGADAFDDLLFGQSSENFWGNPTRRQYKKSSEPTSVKCRYCGNYGFWEFIDGKWKIMDNVSKIHCCRSLKDLEEN